MLLEMAIGDAYGGTFEYAPIEFVNANNDGLAYKTRGRRSPGRYTDDTQMALAITEHILSFEDWTKENLARRFVDVFKRDERVGYAKHFYALLQEVKDGDELLSKLVPDSEKSGGAMRAPMIGIYPNIADVRYRAGFQAAITHNTEAGQAAAQASALMFHYFFYNIGPKKELFDFIQGNVDGVGWNIPYEGPVGSKGWMSVRAAMTAVVKFDSLTDILKACVAYTGDVDTVAAIALAAASESVEVEHNLSSSLFDELENGKYGREYISSLDRRLTETTKEPVVVPING